MLHNLTRFLRAAAAFMGTLGAAYSATWTPINNDLPSRNSGITAIAIDRNTPSTLYAVSNRRTIYKSTDGAATWRMVSGIVGVSSLAITPDSSIYAATSQGVMRNTDGGGSWTLLSNGIGPTTPWITALTVDPSMPSTIYILNTSKLLKSTDGGGSWSVLYDFGTTNFPGSLVVDPVTPSTMYVMNGIGGKIFKSTDGGVSWTQIRGATFNTGFAADAMPLAIDPTDHTTLYAGSFAAFGVPTPQGQPGFGTISKSSDGGSTWKIITAGIPSDAFVRSLALDSANTGVIYAGYVRSGGGGVLKSADAGESWQEMYTVAGTPSGSFIVGVAVGPGAVYAGYSDFGSGGGGLLRTADGGSTWSQANAGMPFYLVLALSSDPAGPGAIYAGGAGLFKTVDGGATWTRESSPHIGTEARFGFGGTDALIRSMAVDFTNPDVLYANTTRPGGCVFDDKVIFKTTDGGASWTDSISPPDSGCMLGGYLISAPSPLIVMDPSDPHTLYLAEGEDEDGGYALLRSSDSGASWNSIWDYRNGLQSGLNLLVVDRRNPGTLYAGVGDAFAGAPIGFFKSTDGSATWNNAGLTNTAVTVLVIDPFDPNTLYAATQGIYTTPRGFRGVFKSVDGGASWTPANSGLDGLAQTGVIVAAMAVDPNHRGTLYAATSGDGVYKTADWGAT